MFTGLIESQGIITRIERVSGGIRIEVYAPEFGRDMAIGDSIAVDGVCLTVTRFIRGAFIADVSAETLSRSTLRNLQQAAKVNLERALRLSDRLGGHLVSGHVDAVGRLEMRQPSGEFTTYRFSFPPELSPYIVEKGSIAIDGISLTIASRDPRQFAVAVIPTTETATTLKEKPIGAPVNLEVDLLAKYVQRFVENYLGAESGGSDAGGGPRKRGLGDMLRDITEGR